MSITNSWGANMSRKADEGYKTLKMAEINFKQAS